MAAYQQPACYAEANQLCHIIAYSPREQASKALVALASWYAAHLPASEGHELAQWLLSCTLTKARSYAQEVLEFV